MKNNAGETDISEQLYERLVIDFWEDRRHELAEEVLRELTQRAAGLSEKDRVSFLQEMRGIARWNAQPNETADDTTGEPVGLAFQLLKTAARWQELLALFFLDRCWEAWERTYNKAPIYAVIDSVLREFQLRGQYLESAGKPREAADRAVATLFLVLREELKTENTASSGSLLLLHEQALQLSEQAAIFAKDLVRLAALAGDDRVLAEEAAVLAEREAEYYGLVSEAAAASQQYLTGESPALAGLIDRIRAAEQSGRFDAIDASELRAHRFDLESLQGNTRPILRIDSGVMTYQFPFGFTGAQQQHFVEAVYEKLTDVATAPDSLGGLRVSAIEREFTVNDVWDGRDPLGLHYSGIEIRFDNIDHPSIDITEKDGLSVSVRLSKLGNHVLLIRSEFEQVYPHQLNVLLSRVAQQSADWAQLARPTGETFRGVVAVNTAKASLGRSQTWANLSVLATSILQGLTEFVSEIDGIRQAESRIRSSFRPSGSAVQTVISGASALAQDGTVESGLSPEAMAETLGFEQFLRSTPQGYASVASWVSRRPRPMVSELSLAPVGHDLLLYSGNNVLITAVTQALYVIEEHVTISDFVISLSGLFASWRAELVNYHDLIGSSILRADTRALRSVEEEPSKKELAKQELEEIEQLKKQEEIFHDFVLLARKTVLAIDSPALVATVRARELLDSLLRKTGYEQERGHFISMVENVLDGPLGQKIENLDRKIAERRQGRTDRQVEVTNAAITAVGLAAIAEVYFSGIDSNPALTFMVLGGVVVVSVGVGLWVRWMRR